MLPPRRSAALASILVAALSWSSVVHAQDFDPRGRHRPSQPAKPGGKPGGTARPPSGASPGGATSKPPGAGTTPNPASETGAAPTVLIERYAKIVLSQPGSPFPLQRLAQLYRDKDGNLNALVSDFEKRAATTGAEQYAATVTLAGIYKLDGRGDDAIKTYEKAITLKGNDATAMLALARLLQDRGDTAAARKRYEQALALQTVPADKEQTVRTLMALALDAKDFAGAKTFHKDLVKMQPSSLFVKGELGRELFTRGEFERAEAEFKELAAAAAGDNRALAPALKELGKAQAKAHKNQEAIATLKKALSVAGSEAAVRAEIYEVITELYRADQQLPMLIKQIEDEHPSDFARLALLGALYEETGDSANALKTYQRALATNPRHIDLRLKMIRLLQSQGELDKAIAEYESLIRAAPNNPEFVFEQCDALIQRGDRARALRLLTQLEARAQGDEEVLSRLADFYGRIGENEKSVHVLSRLTQVAQNDPSHLVDLGDRYFQDGNTQSAVQTWKRILTTVSPRARALAALGEVYLEHDMTADALTALREAAQLEPQNLTYKKQLAGALERARNYQEARTLWTDLGEKSKKNGDKVLAREVRSHMVTLWGLERSIERQIPPLTTQFQANPPDIEAGRTLAEVQIHVRKLPEAEGTLRRVIQLAPGDADSYLALERVLVQEGKLLDAINVLEKLVVVEPKRARELYQRMAQYALQLYRDDDAIKYAARAVELSPEDAEGHRRLGEMYRSRQDTARAIVEFRAALSKNDRLYIVYFELADLLLSKGENDEADRLFRRVLRGAPDEELVARAARLSMQINLGKGTLESLEQELLPLAIGNPQKTIYRRLLVEIYGSLTFGLVQRVKRTASPTATDGERATVQKDAEEARTALARVGGRAVKPLLDALADQDAGQQRVAIDVLGYVQNKNAGAALFSYATGPGDPALRARAMIACGALRDPGLLPKYRTLLFPKGEAQLEEGTPTDAVAVAAVWGLSRMQDKRAVAMLRNLTRHGTPEMRGLSVLGLGQLKDRGSIAEIARVARTLDSGNVARASAAFALGELGADSESATLLSLAQGPDPLPRQLALVALARMGVQKNGEPPGGKAALGAMADAVFAGRDAEGTRARNSAEALRGAGSSALVLLATTPSSARPGTGATAQGELLPVPDGTLDVEGILLRLVSRTFTAKERARAVTKYGDALEAAALAGLRTSAERALTVLDAVGAGEGALRPFVEADAAKDPDVQAAQTRAKSLARALEAQAISLARHPEVEVRQKAIVLLSHLPTDAASEAVVQAVGDRDEEVQRVALAAIGSHGNTRAVSAVAKLLGEQENWAMRVLAVQALGRLGNASPEAGRHLREAATKDSYALVREAAMKALATFDVRGAQEIAQRIATTDPEPRVRESARAILQHGRP